MLLNTAGALTCLSVIAALRLVAMMLQPYARSRLADITYVRGRLSRSFVPAVMRVVLEPPLAPRLEDLAEQPVGGFLGRFGGQCDVDLVGALDLYLAVDRLDFTGFLIDPIIIHGDQCLAGKSCIRPPNGFAAAPFRLLQRLNDRRRGQRSSAPGRSTAQAIFGPLLPLGWLT